MHCPRCKGDTQVVKTRRGNDSENSNIRSRRCRVCGHSFHSREVGQLPEVAKRSGRREPFDRLKLLAVLRIALKGRQAGEPEVLRKTLQNIVVRLMSVPDAERSRRLTHLQIANVVSEVLRETDEVAYVRFMANRRIFEDRGDRPAVSPGRTARGRQPELFDDLPE